MASGCAPESGRIPLGPSFGGEWRLGWCHTSALPRLIQIGGSGETAPEKGPAPSPKLAGPGA